MSNIVERRSTGLPTSGSDGPAPAHSIGATGFEVTRQMKDRLGLIGRVMIGAEERRIAREETKQMLRHALTSQTEELLNRGRLQLSLNKERDYAAYLQVSTEIENYLVSHQAKTQHDLNDLIERFETAYTEQYMNLANKLQDDLDKKHITQAIFDNRMARAQTRYDDAMDKCMAEMRMVIDKHGANMENALRQIPERRA